MFSPIYAIGFRIDAGGCDSHLIAIFIFCRLVHAFTAAGIIPSQYNHFSVFADIGVVGKWYISKRYDTYLYQESLVHTT